MTHHPERQQSIESGPVMACVIRQKLDLFKGIYLFTYLAAPGLTFRLMESGSMTRDWTQAPCTGVLGTGLSGKSLFCFGFKSVIITKN